MNCNNANELMMKYMDGVLTKEESMDLRQHLEICEKCKQEFDVFTQMLDGFEEDVIHIPNLDNDFNKKVMNEVQSIGYIKKPSFLKTIAFNTVATIALIIITSIVFTPSMNAIANNIENQSILNFMTSYNSFILSCKNFITNIDYQFFSKIYINIFIVVFCGCLFIYFKNYHKYYDRKRHIDN